MFSPYKITEVYLKRFIFKYPFLKHEIKKILSKKNIEKKEKLDIKEILNQFDIQKGDTVIIHSSSENLFKICNSSPVSVIKELQNRISDAGNILMPCFPSYDFQSKDPLVYDLQSNVWTGILPNIFLRMPNVERSLFPYNPLAVWGSDKEFFLKNNLDDCFPHGDKSAWFHAIEKHAKIIFLGVSIANSNTISHVVEDLHHADWPIKNWYSTASFKIKYGSHILEKDILYRNGIWERFCASNYYASRLKSAGYAFERSINGVSIGEIYDSQDFFKFMENDLKKGITRYYIPRRYYERKD